MKILTAVICLLAFSISNAATIITYQGQLQDGSGPFTGTANLTFELYDNDEAGSLIAGPLVKEAVDVVDGLFKVELDFGNSIGSQARWLQIEVEGTVLANRQRISAVPLALKALDTGPHSPFEDIDGNAILQQGRVGIGVSEPNFALEIGNIEPLTINGTTYTAGGTIRAHGPGTAIGLTSQGFTTDDPAEEASYGIVASNNTVEGAAIWGVAEHSFGANIGVRGSTQSQDGFAAYFTGRESSRNYFERRVGIGTEDPGAMLQVDGNMISGYLGNTASGTHSFVAGGNTDSLNQAEGDLSFVGGGQDNIASQFASFVGGGHRNIASGSGSFIGGGRDNTASNFDSFIAGGRESIASGRYSFVGGGFQNSALGTTSFAAGLRATAEHHGTFVWADGNIQTFASTGEDQFLVNARGGVGIGTNAPSSQFHVRAASDVSPIRVQIDGTTFFNINSDGGTAVGAFASSTIPSNGLYVAGGTGIGTANPQRDLHIKQSSTTNSSIGLQIERSGNTNNWAFYIATSDNLGFRYNDELKARINASDGAFVAISDARAKQDIQPLTGALDKVLRLQPRSYSMINGADPASRSIGLIAQEVNELFPGVVSEQDERYGIKYSEITVLNTAALIELNQRQQSEIADLNARIDRLEQLLSADR